MFRPRFEPDTSRLQAQSVTVNNVLDNRRPRQHSKSTTLPSYQPTHIGGLNLWRLNVRPLKRLGCCCSVNCGMICCTEPVLTEA
jgi:hypothetical protein